MSVVIPSYNTGRFLSDCIRSIEANSVGVETEVIVVDDGSTDLESQRQTKACEAKSGIKVIRHPRNLGVQAARNTGLKSASGTYVLCLDADDVLLPLQGQTSFLSEAATMLARNSDMAFVHTMSKMFGDFSGLTISSYPLREHLIARKHHVPTAIVYRRQEIALGLLHDEAVPKWQDWALGLSLLARRWRRGEKSEIGFVHGAGHGYRIHSAFPRISRTEISEHDATKIVVGSYQDYFASKFPEIANDVESLTAAVMASKPGGLRDLLFMASFDLKQALAVVGQRKYELSSALVRELGIP